jgi:hypothetical protein
LPQLRLWPPKSFTEIIESLQNKLLIESQMYYVIVNPIVSALNNVSLIVIAATLQECLTMILKEKITPEAVIVIVKVPTYELSHGML